MSQTFDNQPMLYVPWHLCVYIRQATEYSRGEQTLYIVCVRIHKTFLEIIIQHWKVKVCRMEKKQQIFLSENS